jgi:glycosyltransferase involved in cell wall biosynthesis
VRIGLFESPMGGRAGHQPTSLASGLAARGHEVTILPPNAIGLWACLFSAKNRPDVLLWRGSGSEATLGARVDLLFGVPGLWWPSACTEVSEPPSETTSRGEMEAASRARRVLVSGDAERERLTSRIATRDPIRADRLQPLMEEIPASGVTAGDHEMMARLESALEVAACKVPRIWLVSPAPWTKGGVAEVARHILVSPLSRNWRISIVPTYVAGPLPLKLIWALLGFVMVFAGLILRPPSLAHINVGVRGSFARKLVIVTLLRIRRVPFVLHVHGSRFDKFVEGVKGPLRSALNWMFTGADAVLALSDQWAKSISDLIPGANVIVLPNAVDTAQYTDIGLDRLEKRTARNEECKRAVFLGELSQRKGVPDLIVAWKSVERQVPGARLTLAGNGEITRARELCRENLVEDFVDIPGWIGPGEKRELLRDADVFVLPSYAEGVPIALLEAMAAGLPSVVTPVGGFLDAVTDRREAIIVSPGDTETLAQALVELFQDEELALRMGRAARHRVEERSLQNYAGNIGSIYELVLARREQGLSGPSKSEPTRTSQRASSPHE